MTRKAITDLQCSIRKAQRELTEVEPTSAGFEHVAAAIQQLSEHMNMLIQLGAELRQMRIAETASKAPSEASSEAVKVKRGRGRQRCYYLMDKEKRAEYVAKLRTVIEKYYNSRTKLFVLEDGYGISSHEFMACIYDLGIRDGIAAEGAPVKDFSLMVDEAAVGIERFDTAYNTIHGVTYKWRDLVGDRGYGDRAIHLHMLREEEVAKLLLPEYHKAMETMARVDEVWKNMARA